MKKIIILLISLILIAGCTFDINQVKDVIPGLPDDGPQLGSEFGKSGIELEIVNPIENIPILTGYKFSPEVNLEGKGKGVVCLAGLSQDKFKGFAGCECLPIQLNEETLPVQFGIYEVEGTGSETLTTILKYTDISQAKAKLCLKQDVGERSGCRIDGNKLTDGTKGPITITKVENLVQPTGENEAIVKLKVTVEKTQRDGEAYDPKKVQLQECKGGAEIERTVKVKIKDAPFAGNVECEETIIKDEKAELKCDLGQIDLRPLGVDEYTPEVLLELEYGYFQTESISFEVE